MHEADVIDAYARYHPRWFESPTLYRPTEEHLRLYHEVIAPPWTLERSGLWYVSKPPYADLPDQGWKLHISVAFDESIMCLRRALPILYAAGTAFKFLLDPKTVALVNSKLWGRSSGGKFITVYPRTEAEFMLLGAQLAKGLNDVVGPRILSDRQWPDSSCVFYRYGGFRRIPILQHDGRHLLGIWTPGGELVPDERNPFWSPPGWVVDPIPSQNVIVNSDALTLNDGRFTVTTALNFSNRGGVYRGTDNSTGRDVIIKESRPYIVVGRNNADAIALLEKEYRLLKRLAGTGYFVSPITYFREGGHAFLVEEYVPGGHLGKFTITHNPLYRGDLTVDALDHYLGEVRHIWVQLARAITAAHENGILLGDLSFTNVMVGEDLRLVVVDLECAIEEGVDEPVGLYTPGLAAPHTVESGLADGANDLFALGAIMFGSIMLANSMTGFYPPARDRFLDELQVDLALPDALVKSIRTLVDPMEGNEEKIRLTHKIADLPIRVGTTTATVPRLVEIPERRLNRDRRSHLRLLAAETRDAIAPYILSAADLTRKDRLFPADIAVFESNPLSVANGAAGVLYALNRLTGKVPERLVEWLKGRLRDGADIPPGLYVGASGIAWVLNELGHVEDAVELMRSARSHHFLVQSPNVAWGAAGYGLTCLKLWVSGRGEEFLKDAIRVGLDLLNTAVHSDHGAHWLDRDGTVPIGYAYGGSGISLFLLYLHQVTGDMRTIQTSRQALNFELRQAMWRDGNLIGFPDEVQNEYNSENAIARCYWEAGTAGVTTTLVRHLAVAPDQMLQAWVDHLAVDLSHKYAVFPQLFHGLSGLGNALVDLWDICHEERFLSAAWHVAEGVLLFRIDRDEGVGFPGEQCRRESADFATGAAGVGLFLDRLVKADQNKPVDNFNFVVDELLPIRGRELPIIGREPNTPQKRR